MNAIFAEALFNVAESVREDNDIYILSNNIPLYTCLQENKNFNGKFIVKNVSIPKDSCFQDGFEIFIKTVLDLECYIYRFIKDTQPGEFDWEFLYENEIIIISNDKLTNDKLSDLLLSIGNNLLLTDRCYEVTTEDDICMHHVYEFTSIINNLKSKAIGYSEEFRAYKKHIKALENNRKMINDLQENVSNLEIIIKNCLDKMSPEERLLIETDELS